MAAPDMTNANAAQSDPVKEEVKRVMDEVNELDLPDGAHWALVHERLGLEYGDVFDIIAEDPAFFGAVSD